MNYGQRLRPALLSVDHATTYRNPRGRALVELLFCRELNSNVYQGYWPSPDRLISIHASITLRCIWPKHTRRSLNITVAIFRLLLSLSWLAAAKSTVRRPVHYDSFPLASHEPAPVRSAVVADGGPIDVLLAAFFRSQRADHMYQSRLCPLGDPTTLTLPLYRTRLEHRPFVRIALRTLRADDLASFAAVEKMAEFQNALRHLRRRDFLAPIYEFMGRWKHYNQRLSGSPSKVQIRVSVKIVEDDNDDVSDIDDVEDAEDVERTPRRWMTLEIVVGTAERRAVLPPADLQAAGFPNFFAEMAHEAWHATVEFDDNATTKNFHKLNTVEELRVCVSWTPTSFSPRFGPASGSPPFGPASVLSIGAPTVPAPAVAALQTPRVKELHARVESGELARLRDEMISRQTYGRELAATLDEAPLRAVVTVSDSSDCAAGERDAGRRPRRNSGAGGRLARRTLCVDFLQPEPL